MKIKFNYRFDKYSFMELRYVKPKMRGSTPLLAIYFSKWYLSIVVYPIVLNFTKVINDTPRDLSLEEYNELEELDKDK